MLSKESNCSGCVLEQIGTGFMAPSGTGINGVLLVGEALGKDEAAAGSPFVGAAGKTLDKMLLRGGLKRNDFLIANTVWCQPPKNKLSGMWYMDQAIEKCSPYLDRVISNFKPRCIVALGAVAAKRLLPDLPVGILEARGYVFWSERYHTWVLPTAHPSFIMRGKTAWATVLIHDLQRAVEIARDGYTPAETDYTLDCPPQDAMKWVEEFERYYEEHPDLYLSTDIETPEKDANEEDLDLEDGSDYIILRCGYSYRRGHALSIPWDGPYRPIHERLLSHPCQKLFWNGSFDIPRLLSTGITIGGTSHDGMDAWHVLNSDLKKSLGFVTPFFYHGFPMWKHSSSQQPAWYNAADTDTAGVNMRGTVELLKKHGMWKVYKEYIEELDPVYAEMTRAGMPVDLYNRIESSKLLIKERNAVRAEIEKIIPTEIKPLQPKAGYIREPKDKTGLSEFVFNGVKKSFCSICSCEAPKKAHFKSRTREYCLVCGNKWTKTHNKPRKVARDCDNAGSGIQETNPCVGGYVVEKLIGETRWAKVLPFVPSTKGILKYQAFKGHPPIEVGKGDERKQTTDVKAIKKCIGKYPNDPFYPLVLDDRELTKLGGTYIGWWNPDSCKIEGGFPLGRDGRVHGHFRHTPSTLRSSMVSPNLQNLPRGSGAEDDLAILVKKMFVASYGHTFVARDFGGIEAVLVGYHAGSREYMRLAKIDVHSYFTAHSLYRNGVLKASDLPELSWSDSDLAGHLSGIKKRFKNERDIGKRCIHAGNYRVGARKLHEEYPMWFPKTKDAAMALGLYYEVFPEIQKWHERLCMQVDKTCVVTNSFGHVHRFYQVLSWEKRGSDWVWDYADDAKRLIAFGPQSDAAFIGKRALKRLYYGYPDTVRKWLRLFIHDEIFTETPDDQIEYCNEILKLEMEKPIEEMPLNPNWNMGPYVTIGSEEKIGKSWDKMK